MMDFNLQFDIIKPVNMEAAKKFLETEKEHLEKVKSDESYFYTATQQDRSLLEKLNRLKKLISDNKNLYSELDALCRGRPKDVVDTEMDLLVDIMNYCIGNEKIDITGVTENSIVLFSDGSLLNLGLLSYTDTKRCHILCWPSTVAICHLFAQHLHEAGIDAKLYCNRDPVANLDVLLDLAADTGASRNPTDLTLVLPDMGECVGVIAEKSDVDSAVDKFLSSRSKCHWGIRRLYIQESCYERFKRALRWKCSLRSSDWDKSSEGAPQCSEVHCYEDKLFFLDYAGIEDQMRIETKHVVLVEPYRTVKELLSLIKKDPAFYLSLWCSDISEANEIAYLARASIVWINDYAAFGGAFCPSKAFYFCYIDNVPRFANNSKYENFLKNHASWSKLSTESRIKKVKECLNSELFRSAYQDEVSFSEEKCKRLNLKSVDIDNGKIWVDIWSEKGICFKLLKRKEQLVSCIYSMILGNGMLVEEICKLGVDLKLLQESFEANSIPFARWFRLDHSETSLMPIYVGCYKIKTVCTSFGTIFAN